MYENEQKWTWNKSLETTTTHEPMQELFKGLTKFGGFPEVLKSPKRSKTPKRPWKIQRIAKYTDLKALDSVELMVFGYKDDGVAT